VVVPKKVTVTNVSLAYMTGNCNANPKVPSATDEELLSLDFVSWETGAITIVVYQVRMALLVLVLVLVLVMLLVLVLVMLLLLALAVVLLVLLPVWLTQWPSPDPQLPYRLPERFLGQETDIRIPAVNSLSKSLLLILT